ncbi:MAG: metallophosphoesterase [Oligoflexales bacterium]|nr:metallophosphoesterase [Oligoflexales bacterium]
MLCRILKIIIFMTCFHDVVIYAADPIQTAVDSVVRITILHTNDTHGHYQKDQRSRACGFAAQKSLVDEIRKEVAREGGHLLILSAGDINTGAPESGFFRAEPDIISMNIIGYDAMTLGNHEFDGDLDKIFKQQALAKFPFLSANTYLKKEKKLLVKPYIIKRFGGLHIGVIGFTTTQTGNMTLIPNIEFRDVFLTAEELVPQLRKQVDFIIALTHLGFYLNNEDGLHGFGDIELAKSMHGQIDVIIGGHTHTRLDRAYIVASTAILQAWEHGKVLGRVDLIFKNKKFISLDYKLIPINPEEDSDLDTKVQLLQVSHSGQQKKIVPEDPELLHLFEQYNERIKDRFTKRITRSKGFFWGRSSAPRGETNLGRLVSQAFCEEASGKVCFVKTGALRIDLVPGDLTYSTLEKLMPFHNRMCKVELSTSDFVKFIETLLRQNSEDDVHFFGIKFRLLNGSIMMLTVTDSKGTRALVSDFKIMREEDIQVVSSCYLMSGKDNSVDASNFSSFVRTDFIDTNIVENFLRKKQEINPEDYATPSRVDHSDEL